MLQHHLNRKALLGSKSTQLLACNFSQGKSIPSILVSLLQTLNPQPLPPGSEKPLGPDSPAIPVNVPMTSISSSFTHPSEVLARLWSSLGEREISLNQMRISLEATTNGNEGRWDEIIRVKGECLKAWDVSTSLNR